MLGRKNRSHSRATSRPAEPSGSAGRPTAVIRGMPPTVVSLLVCTLATAGCGAGSGQPSEAAASTSLVIRATNGVAGTAVFTLRCDPPGGTLPDARRVCARLSAAPPAVLLAPKAYECPGTALSPWRVRISGHRGDRPIHVDIATCWTPQVRLIRLLGISWHRVIDAARAAG